MKNKPDFFAKLFDPKNVPKEPTLPANVIEAVKQYKLKQHQIDLSNWLKQASDKSQVDADGNTLAHLAALAGHVTVFTYVVGKGVNPGVLNKKGSNTLIALIEQLPKITHLPKTRAGYLACIAKCLEYGVDPMCTDGMIDKPAMACAVITGDLELVQLLVSKGVSVNQNGILGYPLTLAKKCVTVNPDLVHYLEQQGAIENPTNGL
jgi:ankyrin repeat protein